MGGLSSHLQKLFWKLQCYIWLQHYLTNGYVPTQTRVQFVGGRVRIFEKRYKTGLENFLISSLYCWQ